MDDGALRRMQSAVVRGLTHFGAQKPALGALAEEEDEDENDDEKQEEEEEEGGEKVGGDARGEGPGWGRFACCCGGGGKSSWLARGGRRKSRKVGFKEEPQILTDLSHSVSSLGNGRRRSSALKEDVLTILDGNKKDGSDGEEDAKSTVSTVSSTASETKEDPTLQEEDAVHGAEEEKSPEDGYSTAAVGLCVNAGSFDDPPELPGLAHFVEHMVFMGSKKYPGENEFDQFIQKTGGDTNAITEGESTVFHFYTQRRHLKEGE